MNTNVRTILEGLNDQQKIAVQQMEGPVLIVAGAGSGKTRVLTSRIAYMLASGVDPSSILALTFTKKAAEEMKERVSLAVGSDLSRRLVMGTFHSIFIRFLRKYAEFLHYPDSFTIYDQDNSISAMKACIKELELDDKTYKPRDVLSRISLAKNELYTAEAYRMKPELVQADQRRKLPRICDLYSLYQKKLKESGVMDFDDILVNTNILLRDNPAACEEIASRFKYIMVDEYQDTNYSQNVILKRLAQRHHNICVVGDDSQSIYAFRGARIENILGFRKTYPECRIIRLERNYRSTRNIVDAANSVIEKNAGRIPKQCFSEGDAGEKIKLLRCFDGENEALMLALEIQGRLRQDRAAYSDFAILYRTNSQSRAIEDALRRKNIPYMIYSGNSFFDRAEIKDMMAYFKLVANPLDNESFKRAVNLPARGIGGTSLSALNECARANGGSLFNAAFREDTALYGLRDSALAKIRAFCKIIDSMASMVASTDALEMARLIYDRSGLYLMYKADNSVEGQARTSNLDELLNSVAAYVNEQTGDVEEGSVEGVPLVTLGDYLENISLLSNVDVDEEDDSNKVALMTVHSSKGLEFPHVMICGMEESLFPSYNGGGAGMGYINPKDLEEERRLFYVAITRARTSVTISFADERFRNGRRESNDPSRFISEIDVKYLDNPTVVSGCVSKPVFGAPKPSGPFAWKGPSMPQRTQFAPRPQTQTGASKPQVIDANFVAVPMTELREGERVEHNRFGAGTILEITGSAPEMRARVRFDIYGEKLLMLKFAKLRHLN